jgi:hypothetical protein
MKRLLYVLLVSGCLLAGAVPARADLLYSTFGEPGDTYSLGSYAIEGSIGRPFGVYDAQAEQFSPSETAILNTVRFAAVAGIGGGGGGSIDVLLAEDSAGQPGAALENLGSVALPANDIAAIYTLSSVTHPLLTSGTPYWLILQPSDPNSDLSAGLNFASPIVTGTVANRVGGPDQMWSPRTTGQGAFDISGSAVPEPASLALLAVAGLVGVSAAWRRRGRHSTGMEGQHVRHNGRENDHLI